MLVKKMSSISELKFQKEKTKTKSNTINFLYISNPMKYEIISK